MAFDLSVLDKIGTIGDASLGSSNLSQYLIQR